MGVEGRSNGSRSQVASQSLCSRLSPAQWSSASCGWDVVGPGICLLPFTVSISSAGTDGLTEPCRARSTPQHAASEHRLWPLPPAHLQTSHRRRPCLSLSSKRQVLHVRCVCLGLRGMVRRWFLCVANFKKRLPDSCCHRLSSFS